MSKRYTRPDQFYGKLPRVPKDIPDIRKKILPFFSVLLLLELVIAVAAFRYWRQQTLVLEDQRVLFRANEIISESRQDSLQLGRLLNLAIASPTKENINSYEALVKKKSAPVLETPTTADTILNTLVDVTPSNLKLRNASIAFGETEWLRFDRVADEFSKLRSIDEKALAALNSNAATLDGLEQTKSNATLDILAEHSYEARRIRLNDDFSAMQSAIDLRILTLLKADADDGRFFFSLALFTLIVLAPTTIWLGIFLNDHEARVHHSHKSQVRRLNDDLTRLRGELPHHQPDHPAPTPGENPADL
jgi:hypothetical protein